MCWISRGTESLVLLVDILVICLIEIIVPQDVTHAWGLLLQLLHLITTQAIRHLIILSFYIPDYIIKVEDLF